MSMAKQAQRVLDYDDLLLYWAQMMTLAPIAADVGGRFDFVLVDEYQDTNALQAEILLRLKPDGAGSPWSAMTPRRSTASARRHRAQHPRLPGQVPPPAEVITLEQNYRSTQPILDAANAVIALAPERFTKNLFTTAPAAKPWLVTVPDEPEQVDFVVRQVLENREAGVPLKRAGRAVPHRAPQRRARDRAGPAQHPVRQVRRAAVPRGGARQGRARVLRLAENPRDGWPGSGSCSCCPASAPARRAGRSRVEAANFLGLRRARPLRRRRRPPPSSGRR